MILLVLNRVFHFTYHPIQFSKRSKYPSISRVFPFIEVRHNEKYDNNENLILDTFYWLTGQDLTRQPIECVKQQYGYEVVSIGPQSAKNNYPSVFQFLV